MTSFDRQRRRRNRGVDGKPRRSRRESDRRLRQAARAAKNDPADAWVWRLMALHAQLIAFLIDEVGHAMAENEIITELRERGLLKRGKLEADMEKRGMTATDNLSNALAFFFDREPRRCTGISNDGRLFFDRDNEPRYAGLSGNGHQLLEICDGLKDVAEQIDRTST